MAMIPENPVVGGNELRRQAIESPNFVTGVSGWAIMQDGSAEFNNVVIRNGQIVSGTVLFYNPSPGAGNLIASLTASTVPTTDTYGNTVLPGFAVYNPSGAATNPGTTVELNAGEALFGDPLSPDAATHTAAIGRIHQTGAGATPIAFFDGGANGTAADHPTIWMIGGAAPSGAGSQIALFSADTGGSRTDAAVNVIGKLYMGTISGGLPNLTGPVFLRGGAAVLLLTSVDTDTAATTALLEMHGKAGQTVVELIANAAAAVALAARVAADTNDRFTVSAAGVVSWGTGAAGTDTTVQRSAAGVLQVLSTFVTTVAGVAEVWHTLGTLAGYTVRVGLFRLDVLGNLELDIVVVAGGANAVSTTFSVTLPAAYRPVNQKEIPAATSTNIAAGVTQPRVVIATTGAVTVQLAANSTSTLYMSGMVPLN